MPAFLLDVATPAPALALVQTTATAADNLTNQYFCANPAATSAAAAAVASLSLHAGTYTVASIWAGDGTTGAPYAAYLNTAVVAADAWPVITSVISANNAGTITAVIKVLATTTIYLVGTSAAGHTMQGLMIAVQIN